MSEKVKPREGDVFSIEIDVSCFVFGVILHLSKEIKDGMLIAIFDKPFNSQDGIVDLQPDAFPLLDVPNYTSKKAFIAENWQILSSRPDISEAIEIPQLIAGNTLYFKDEIVKDPIEPHERKRYRSLSGQGRLFIENKLRKHFLEQS